MNVFNHCLSLFSDPKEHCAPHIIEQYKIEMVEYMDWKKKKGEENNKNNILNKSKMSQYSINDGILT